VAGAHRVLADARIGDVAGEAHQREDAAGDLEGLRRTRRVDEPHVASHRLAHHAVDAVHLARGRLQEALAHAEHRDVGQVRRRLRHDRHCALGAHAVHDELGAFERTRELSGSQGHDPRIELHLEARVALLLLDGLDERVVEPRAPEADVVSAHRCHVRHRAAHVSSAEDGDPHAYRITMLARWCGRLRAWRR